MLETHRNLKLDQIDREKIEQMFSTIYDEKNLGETDKNAAAIAIQHVIPGVNRAAIVKELENRLVESRKQRVQESRDVDDLLQQWTRINTGLDFRTLEKLITDIGYRDLEEFFGDNPGAVGSVMAFVVEQIDRCPEWESNLRDSMHDSEDEFN